MENNTLKRILIVDDDQDFVKALTTFLSGHGYTVLAASDAMFAIQYAIREKVDLVVLDLGLPCGGGFSVLENLRKVRKVTMPIIVSTANVSAGVENKVHDLGADGFIPKPYDLEKLLEIIKARLR